MKVRRLLVAVVLSVLAGSIGASSASASCVLQILTFSDRECPSGMAACVIETCQGQMSGNCGCTLLAGHENVDHGQQNDAPVNC